MPSPPERKDIEGKREERDVPKGKSNQERVKISMLV